MIAVLSRDCSESVLAAILGDAQGRGWRVESSRGADQTILFVSGPTTTDELEQLLAPRVEADVIGLRSRREYEWIARRRSLMHALAWVLALLVAAALLVPALGFLQAPAEALKTRDAVRVARLDDILPNTAKLVRIEGERLFVVRLSRGPLFALAASCTFVDHCQLQWSSERLQLVCPCDGGVFDVYGSVVQGPPFAPLRSYPVRVLDGIVYVGTR